LADQIDVREIDFDGAVGVFGSHENTDVS